MSEELSLKETKKEWHGTLKSYLIGFIASLVLTALSFYLVANQVMAVQTLVLAIVALAMIQAAVQLIFFLHVGQEAEPRWETLIFYFMLLLLFVVVLGTFWVMSDLNERVMSHMTTGMKQ